VFVVARIYAHKKTKEALAVSTVKIQGNDVMATWKILVAGGLAPILYTYYALVLASWTYYNRINGFIPISVPIWSIVLGGFTVFPIVTYAALRLGEIGMDILKSLKSLVLCLSPSFAGIIAQLQDDRTYLSEQVTELVNTLGPDLFPDCDAAKFPQPRRLYSNTSPDDSLDDLIDSEFF
jgi:glycerol-3-phosphate O-acyltransferase/dihydroxyacetone phosphate acyltransferase